MTPDLLREEHGAWVGPMLTVVFSLSISAGAQAIPLSGSSSEPPPREQLYEEEQAPSDRGKNGSPSPAQEASPGIGPVTGDMPASNQDVKDPQQNKKDDDSRRKSGRIENETSKADSYRLVEVGSEKITVKPGSIDDVNAIGTRDIGRRGMGNWYSTESEIKMGKTYAMDIERSIRFITDPVVTEFVNRVGQNIVKNSDCKVPFTIKIIDSDEINAMALPGGFFYINSGLILSSDEEAEMAGVMAHEVAHVCAHHAARQMTRMKYAQLGMVPVIMMTGYSWTGFGIYQASQFAVPVAFLKFNRDFEAQADYLGIQYAYRSGYDPQAAIRFFEKVQALEKRRPGVLARAFADHPQTPDRIVRSQEEIARILPPRDQYIVTTSEFEDVKGRLARIQNKRRLLDPTDKSKPSLRRASSGSDPDSQETYDRQDRPTLHPREDQEH